VTGAEAAASRIAVRLAEDVGSPATALKMWAHLQRQGITAVRLAAAFGRGAKGSGFFLPVPDGLNQRAYGYHSPHQKR
jgi:hypothetical protein